MSMRDNLDISAYLVLGPENTLGRPVADVVEQALDAGFTCMQIRSKVCSVRDLIEYTAQAADVIARAGKSDQVALLIDDRLDAVLAARERGIKCDGVHVGQSDIPVGPLHETATKKDAGLTSDGSIVTQDFDDLRALHEVSPRPIVVGGGVKAADLPALKATGVEGFFVVSAVCSAPDPHAAAAELVETWRQA